MTMLNNYKILVISLPGSPRRKQIVQEFAKHEVDFEFVDAIRGNSLDLYNDERINTKRLTEIGMIKIPGNVGAALSHIKCHQKIVEENLDFALIFEDDMSLEEELKSLLPLVIAASSREGVTMLFYQSFSEIVLEKSKSIKIDSTHSLYDYGSDKTIFSGAAYIIWNKSAKKLVDYLLPVCASPDAWNLFKKDGVIKDIKLIHPMLCSHALCASEMTYPVKSRFKKILNPFTKNLKHVNILVVQNLLKRWRKRQMKLMEKVRIVD